MSRRKVIACGGVVATGALALCLGGCTEKHESQVSKAVERVAAEICPLSNVPKHGGIVVDSANIVLIREGGDNVKAFSSICTHAGCSVSEVVDEKIKCACHGSEFSAKDGTPISGPAKKPLQQIDVEIKDGIIVR